MVEAQPGFPWLKTVSCAADVIKFAIEVDHILQITLFPPADSDPVSLHLPVVTANALQPQFTVDEMRNSVFTIVRSHYFLFYEKFLAPRTKNSRGIFITGPMGIGKSHLLYLVVSQLRQNKSRYRVIYFHNCKEFVLSRYRYMAHEFLMAFFNDKELLECLTQFLDCAYKPDEAERAFETALSSIIKYVGHNGLRLFVVFDQHNALSAVPHSTMTMPFCVVNRLAFLASQNSDLTVVVSASANDETCPLLLDGWTIEHCEILKYDTKEFKVWCSQQGVEDDHETIKSAFFWTGGNPLELDYLARCSHERWDKRLSEYLSRRVEEIIKLHNNFVKNASEEEKRSLYECIARMALGSSVPKGLHGMNRQLFLVISDNDETKLAALNPIVRRALLSYHSKESLNAIKLASETVFSDVMVDNSTKGTMAERYIISVLEETSSFLFSCEKTNVSRRSKPIIIEGSIADIVYFEGNGLPPRSSFQKGRNTLFVPFSKNYPGVDFFIWNATEQQFLVLQVTVQKPMTGHSDVKQGDIEKWRIFMELMDVDILILWIVPEECIPHNWNSMTLRAGYNNYVVTFESMRDLFPAFNRFKLHELALKKRKATAKGGPIKTPKLEPGTYFLLLSIMIDTHALFPCYFRSHLGIRWRWRERGMSKTLAGEVHGERL